MVRTFMQCCVVFFALVFALTTFRSTAEPTTIILVTTPTAAQEADERFVLSDYASVQSATDISRSELDPAYRPLDLLDRHYTGVGPDGELYLIDWVGGEREQITHDGFPIAGAVLSAQYVAWIAETAQTTVRHENQDYPEPLHHIFVQDRATGERMQITAQPAHRMEIAIDGNLLVWADKRNEAADHYTHYDIYGYDLLTASERPIAIAPGAQSHPAIHGDRVVWQDNRTSPHLGKTLAGCGNCPKNRYDLYLYDWPSERSEPLVEDAWFKSTPSIDAEHVTWIGYSNDAQGDVYVLELRTGTIRRLTDTADYKTRPLLAGDRVLWTIGRSCDVVEIAPDGQSLRVETGLYAFDLGTNVVHKLTDSVEPFALADEGTALAVEGCMVDFPAYVVRFDTLGGAPR